MIEDCPKFNYCSIPVCPLDGEAHLRNRLPDEKICPYASDRKKWGKRESLPQRLRKLIPKPNIKLLSEKNRRLL